MNALTLQGVVDYLKSKQSLIALVFFSNYFYGLCAIALSIEASLQQNFPLNSLAFYIFSFCITVLYYTKAYITEKKTGLSNPRSVWYYEQRRIVFISQVVLTVYAVVFLVILLSRHFQFIFRLPTISWVLMFTFPVVAALYYGINHRTFAKYNLRNIGWLKPFIIGFVWAGLVTVYPIMFYDVAKEIVYVPDWSGGFLFVKNFMYITVLCIMFDIKDYAADHNKHLKTFVVKAGLRKTIFVIVIPLCVLGLTSYIFYSVVRSFSMLRMFFNIIPFILLIAVAYSLHRRKSIFYYLIVIDGLMMIKAVFGIFAMMF
jgi:hypothetical protein